MLYRITVTGTSPIIMHNGAGVDTSTPAGIEKAEITSRRGSNRTAADNARLKELETLTSLWLDDQDAPTIPTSALRSCIETGARRLRQGQQVREGLLVLDSSFQYNTKTYGSTLAELLKTTQYTVPVVQQRQRILRTRARFNTPWSAKFTIEGDDELVDVPKLEAWLDISGRRIGLGDWRPEKSGIHGRFTAEVEVVE